MKGHRYHSEGQKAVDGRVDGNTGRSAPARCKGNKSNWWEVDLQGTYPIYLVLIHNRWDHPEQINGAVVKVGSTTCGTVKYHRDVRVYAINCKGTRGSTVRVEQENNFLVLPEVQVYGRASGGDLGAFFTTQTNSKCFLQLLCLIFRLSFKFHITAAYKKNILFYDGVVSVSDH